MDEGNGSLCLPATISVVAFWLSAGFATARMLQGCYMVQRQGVCGSRFDSDDVQTCGIIVLLLCGQFTAEHYFSIEVSFKGSGFTCCIE